MFGVESACSPRLIAKIGDVRRFYSKEALAALTDIDVPPY